MPLGLSTDQNCTKIAACLAGTKYKFVVRYYCAGANSKKLGLAEAQALSKAGLDLVVVYENSDKLGYFHGGAGHRDGVDAYHYARELNQTSGSGIYFAADFNPDEPEVAGPINDYFRGVAKGFADAASPHNPQFTIGVYGSGLCCQWLKAHNSNVKLTWLSESTSFRGSATYADWNMKQRIMKPSESVCALKVDPHNSDHNQAETNTTQGEFGAFRLTV